jgi:geranylgeranyl diphosphate synthase type I
MIARVKNRIEKELCSYARRLCGPQSLGGRPPLLSETVKRFILRKGKRIRPLLFALSYLGFAGREARGLYRSAISFEILHDFFLVHDDIIDDSDLRRGLPSMHRMLSSKGLAIAAGDALCGMALELFMSIDESPLRKERAMAKFAGTILDTSAGEFIELLYSDTDIGKISREAIYRIYDLKTARYTFSSPLVLGAMLAGAGDAELSKLSRCGIYLGRAFQIRDDILDMFGTKGALGKSPMTDIKESKKTLLLWHAYRGSNVKERFALRKIFSRRDKRAADLGKARRIVLASGALEICKKEAASLAAKAKKITASLKMRPQYKSAISEYLADTLKI